MEEDGEVEVQQPVEAKVEPKPWDSLDDLRTKYEALQARDNKLLMNENTSKYSLNICWEPKDKGSAPEVDITVCVFDDRHKSMGQIDFDSRKQLNGGLEMTEEFPNRPESGGGENVDVDFDLFPVNTKTAYINIATKSKLEELKTVWCDILDKEKNNKLATFRFNPRRHEATSLIFCSITRHIEKPHLYVMSSVKQRTTMLGENLAKESQTLAAVIPKCKPTPLSDIQLYRSASFYGNFCGRFLTSIERVNIQSALTKIQISRNITNLDVWGKIYGQKEDYIIAYSVSYDEKIQKEFYYSYDKGHTFNKMVDTDDWVEQQCMLHFEVFAGKPTYRYKDPSIKKNPDADEEEEEEEEDKEEEEEEGKEKKRRLREDERLAWVVKSINERTCIVPTGQYYLDAFGKVKQDQTFKGLSPEQSTNLGSYFLFQDPKRMETVNLIRRFTVKNRHNFMDTIDAKGSRELWSLQTNETGEIVTLRSLICPGFEYHLTVNSKEFGGAYFGYGQVDLSVAFMLPQGVNV